MMDDPQGFADEILAAHNRVRGDLRVPATPLRWSSSLAREAHSVAAECRFRHSHGPHGENLYARAQPTRPRRVVKAWAGEASDFSLASNRCADDEICGHYTQMIWGDSRAVGCAVHQCSTGSPFDGWTEWTLWVCEYDPPGNIRGQRP